MCVSDEFEDENELSQDRRSEKGFKARFKGQVLSLSYC